jgi:transposase
MRGQGAPQWLEQKRRLAVARLGDGYTPEEVADFLDVGLSSVYRWQACHREWGGRGLAAHPVSGRPPKLTPAQAREVLGWLQQAAQEFGFPTARWTAPRLAQVITREWGTEFHPRYLNAWLRQRGITPQVPMPVARERDPAAIARWVAHRWPAIKKSPGFGRGLDFHR